MSAKAKGRGKKGGDKKEVDPEVLAKQKFRAKCRFRSCVRLALANAYWLIEEQDQYEGLDDVKKRVAQAMRKKVEKKKLLSLTDKGLLCKPATDRTEQEKKYIYRIIGGLKCFNRYPAVVKKKLASVTYFQYYGPGRVIVRQHQEAHAMYFIVSGLVTVSHLIYDGLLNTYVPVDIGEMHAGDMFGEVSLLHNITRTATCTTADHCEFLQLLKEDFKSILQATIQASWDKVRQAMSYFTYFDALDEVARREGCIMAKMKSYAVNDIIFGDRAGVPNFVYFVLSGRCQMIESLKISSYVRLGHTYYSLYDPHVSEIKDEEDFENKYMGYRDKSEEAQPMRQDSSTSQTFKVLDSIMKSETGRSSKRLSKGVKRTSVEPRKSETAHISAFKNVTMPDLEELAETGEFARVQSPQDETLLEPPDQSHRESVRFSMVMDSVANQLPPPNLRTYFMQVCQFNPGSTFGLGENMRDRRIVAQTPIECLLLPKVWLLTHNTANIWTRIRHFLEKKCCIWCPEDVMSSALLNLLLWVNRALINIPNKRQLFKLFLTERRWEEFREQLVTDVVSRSNTVNSTTVHDVPYSIRMEEMLNL